MQRLAGAYLYLYFLILPFLAESLLEGSGLVLSLFLVAGCSYLVSRNLKIPSRFPANPMALFILMVSLVRVSSDLMLLEIHASIAIMPSILGILYIHFTPLHQRQVLVPALVFFCSLLISRVTLLEFGISDLSDHFAHAYSFLLVFALLYFLFLRRLKWFFLFFLLFLPFLQRDALVALLLISVLYFLPASQNFKLLGGYLILFALLCFPFFLYLGGRDLAIELAKVSTMRTVYYYELLDFRLSNLSHILSWFGENIVGEVLTSVTSNERHISSNYPELMHLLMKNEGYHQCAHNITVDLVAKYGLLALLLFVPLFLERNLQGLMVTIVFVTVQALQCGLDDAGYLIGSYLAYDLLRRTKPSVGLVK